MLPKGLTFVICIGRYAGFHFSSNRERTRLLLGIISITFYWFDVEVLVGETLEAMRDASREIEEYDD